jgi:hypothetical protein
MPAKVLCSSRRYEHPFVGGADDMRGDRKDRSYRARHAAQLIAPGGAFFLAWRVSFVR